MIKVSPSMGMWTTFSSQIILSIDTLGITTPYQRRRETTVFNRNDINSKVLGLVTYLVASLTHDNARTCVMHIAFLTQRKVSSIPIVLSWGSSISPDSFLPSILLLVVIIVAVVIVVVTVVLVVVVSEGSSIIKLSFVIIGFLHRIVLCYLIH
ncbi:hypothetical protein Tco_0213255 [Tanacetum coccineum]